MSAHLANLALLAAPRGDEELCERRAREARPSPCHTGWDCTEVATYALTMLRR
ncbi:hypothetical protein [Micromonospora sp. NPDC048842]|uniref:hypothetical protein n=1 Tax=unclassified Micromonospora TaxID=2617518 RepID=UPI0033D26F2A